MKKLLSLSLVFVAVFISANNVAVASSYAVSDFIQHVSSETYWILGFVAMTGSLTGFMVMQKGMYDRNQATFFLGTSLPVWTSIVFGLTWSFLEPDLVPFKPLLGAFVLTLIPFVFASVVYIFQEIPRELVHARSIYASMYLGCCVLGGCLGAPMQVFIGSMLAALIGGYIGKLWFVDAHQMNEELEQPKFI